MGRCLVAVLLFRVTHSWDDSNFFDWFRTELNETVGHPIEFEGEVPSYVKGTFVQTGPARFSFGDMRFTHMLDGYSKTVAVQFAENGAATYSTKFLRSAFLNESIKAGGIARGMFVGPIEPPPHWGPTGAILGSSDNNYIKMRMVGDQKMILADTMVASWIDDDALTLDHTVRPMVMTGTPGKRWEDDIDPIADMCMLATMAHAAEDKATGVLTGSMGCFGGSGAYHVVFHLEPSAPNKRKLLAKVDLPFGRPASYMHAMGSTPNYIILIAEPLFMNLEGVLTGASLGKGGLRTTNESTLFQIVDRKSGAVRVLEAPGFIYGHVINSFEGDDGDVVIDLTWYEAGNATTLGWFNRWFLEYIEDPAIREPWKGTTVTRYRLKADNTVESFRLYDEDVEVPKINEKFDGLAYCNVYFMQFHSYEYDKDQSARTPGPMGAVGLAKRNICTGERSGWYQPNAYPSEVQFIPNPAGKSEDDGVLLGMVFDGNTNTSFFHILDAQTMKQVARAPLPIKSPFLVHASFFPDTSLPLSVFV